MFERPPFDVFSEGIVEPVGTENVLPQHHQADRRFVVSEVAQVVSRHVVCVREDWKYVRAHQHRNESPRRVAL